MHKHLPKEVYRWKINDPYHGGVPDAFYSGQANSCFIEYKYTESLPKKESSYIKLNLSEQQRNWLKLQQNNNLFVYAVFASPGQVYVIEDFNLKQFTLKEYNERSCTFNNFIKALSSFCLQKGNLT